MSGALLGMPSKLAELQSYFKQSRQFVCSPDFSQLTKDPGITIIANKMQLIEVADAPDTVSQGTDYSGIYFDAAAKQGVQSFKAPWYPFKGKMYIQELRPIFTKGGAGCDLSFVLSYDSAGTTGIIIDFGTFTPSQIDSGIVLTVNTWVDTDKLVYLVVTAGANATSSNYYGWLLNSKNGTSEGYAYTNSSNSNYYYKGTYSIGGAYCSEATWSKTIRSLFPLKWGQIYGQQLTDSTGINKIDIKDKDGTILKTITSSDVEPIDLSDISIDNTELTLEGTMTKVAFGDVSPTVSPFTVIWDANLSVPAHLYDLLFQTSAPISSHQTYTHLNITGSGYLVRLHSAGTTRTFSVEIDGSIYSLSILTGAEFFPVRFNNSLKVTCSVGAGASENAWVVLD